MGRGFDYVRKCLDFSNAADGREDAGSVAALQLSYGGYIIHPIHVRIITVIGKYLLNHGLL